MYLNLIGIMINQHRGNPLIVMLTNSLIGWKSQKLFCLLEIWTCHKLQCEEFQRIT